MRIAYAEIIRKSDELFGLIAPRPLGYVIESSKTQHEADKTLSTVDRAKGGVIGLGTALLGVLADVTKGGIIYVKAVAGNEEAGEQLGKTVDGVIGLASSPELWGKILTNATQEQHAKIADAYEKGDGEALGKIVGEVYSNLVGSGVGTVGKAGKAAGAVGDLAKVAKDVEKAAGISATGQTILLQGTPILRSSVDEIFMGFKENSRIFAHGEMNNRVDGQLSISIRTYVNDGVDAVRIDGFTGSKAYDDIFAHFGSRVTSVRNTYIADNAKAFNQFVSQGNSMEQAAMKTWDGQQLLIRGFNNVQVTTRPLPDGSHTDISTVWTK